MTPYPSTFQPLPLNPWGCFKGHKRVSDSPYIETVWEGVATHDGVHLTAADGTIDLTLQTRQGETRMLLSGPTSRAKPIEFKSGDEILAMRLRSGVYFPFATSTTLTDVDRPLASADSHHFWLHHTALTFPNFSNVETFVENAAKLGLLRRDIVVEDTLAGRIKATNPRTIQRHFLASTGMTMNHVRQIRRAENARSLLDSDHTLTTIAYQAGYSNPGHMTNAFKYFFGQTPSAMRHLMVR
jgi:AraC-like DNA-binding protein